MLEVEPESVYPHRAVKQLEIAATGASDQASRPWVGAQSS